MAVGHMDTSRIVDIVVLAEAYFEAISLSGNTALNKEPTSHLGNQL